jgi:hypothetical protein
MTHRLGTRLLAVLLPATALLLPPAAHAERVVTEDAVGDVVSEPYDTSVSVEATDDPPEEVADPFVPDPDNETSDITRTAVDHRTGVLKVTASFRDLRHTFHDSLVMRIRTPQRRWTVYVERSGKQTLTAMSGRRSDSTCRGLRTTADLSTDRIDVKVPTSCIGDPRWVQVGLGVFGTEVTHDPEVGDVLHGSLDDAFGTGWDAAADRLTYGPEVRRG